MVAIHVSHPTEKWRYILLFPFDAAEIRSLWNCLKIWFLKSLHRNQSQPYALPSISGCVCFSISTANNFPYRAEQHSKSVTFARPTKKESQKSPPAERNQQFQCSFWIILFSFHSHYFMLIDHKITFIIYHIHLQLWWKFISTGFHISVSVYLFEFFAFCVSHSRYCTL